MGTNQVQETKGRFETGPKLLVRKGGLEPPRFYPPDPKSGASANSATLAIPKSTTSLDGTGRAGNVEGSRTHSAGNLASRSTSSAFNRR